MYSINYLSLSSYCSNRIYLKVPALITIYDDGNLTAIVMLKVTAITIIFLINNIKTMIIL